MSSIALILFILAVLCIGAGVITAVRHKREEARPGLYTQQESPADNAKPRMTPQSGQSAQQPVPRQPAQAVSQTPRAASPIKTGSSLRDEEGGSICTICGKPLAGFGRFGGFCSSCGEWNYDRGSYMLHQEIHGVKAETLFVLAAYENTHYHCQGEDHKGTLYVTPGSLIFCAKGGKRFILLFSDISHASATRGSAQQLTILVHGDEYTARHHDIDLQGHSYDGAEGEDLLRIRRLIQQSAAV